MCHVRRTKEKARRARWQGERWKDEEEDAHLWWHRDLAGWGLHRRPLPPESQIRFLRAVPGDEAGQNVRPLLVPALHRAEGDVRRRVSLCTVCGVRDQGLQ